MSVTTTGTLGSAHESGDLSVLEGAIRIARQAETHPSGVRRRLWALASVAGVGLALLGGVLGALLSRGVPSHPSLRLLSAFALLVGAALLCASAVGAVLTFWSVLHYQRLLLTELRAEVFEMTARESGQDVWVAPEEIARALDGLRKALIHFQHGARSDAGDDVAGLLRQVEAARAALDALVGRPSGPRGQGRE